MTLKEFVCVGLFYGGMLSLGTMGTQRVDQYSVRTFAGQTTLWPAPGNLTAVLIDSDGDCIPDRKYSAIASRNGYRSFDFPVTEQDREVFFDITSRL